MNTIREGEFKFHESPSEGQSKESKTIHRPIEQPKSLEPRVIEPR